MQDHCPSDPRIEAPTLLEALIDRAARRPEATAVVADGEHWSCRRLVEDSARLASVLHARGVRAGDCVALHMRNRAEYVLCYLACWRVGAVAVSLKTQYKAAEIAAILARTGARLYLGERDLLESLRHVSEEVLPHASRLAVDGGAAGRQEGPPAVSWAGGPVPAAPPEPLGGEAPAVLLITSGTAGQEKLVVWTHRVLAAFMASAEGRGAGAEDVILLTSPLTHASGLAVLCACLLTGATAVLIENPSADAVLDAIARQRCTTVFALPQVCADLARRRQDGRREDTQSLRLCITGGDVCPTLTEEAFRAAFGLSLVSAWGSTEDVSCMLPATRPGPLTRLVPGTEIRLVDPSGAPVAAEEAGEMLIRSPGTASGYWIGPGRIDAFEGGWFRSGDLMRREPDGHLRYMGRLRDVIVRGGVNVSPQEVESVLRRQPHVLDVAVAGVPDPEMGQRVGAALVVARGATVSAIRAVIDGANPDLADYKMPEWVVVVEAIPRNALTKVDRRAVASLLVERGSRVR